MSPQIDGNVQVSFGNQNWATRFRGASPEYLPIRRWTVAKGHAFSHQDVEESAAKVLLGETVRKQLFGDADPIGETVRLRGMPYEVVGLLAPKGQSAEGRDQDDWILLPHTTAQKRLKGRGQTWLDDIFLSAASPEAIPIVSAQLVSLMRQRHRIGPDMEDDFNLRRPDEVLKAQEDAASTLQLLLVAVASIALVVGGIGVMNVMLATVVQRTREIGLRLAVGATEGAVRAQFLGEASAISLVGGLLGVAVSAVGAEVLAHVLGWAVRLPPFAVVLAVGSAVGVGLFFGFFPAWRASRLDPIEALRHE